MEHSWLICSESLGGCQDRIARGPIAAAPSRCQTQIGLVLLRGRAGGPPTLGSCQRRFVLLSHRQTPQTYGTRPSTWLRVTYSTCLAPRLKLRAPAGSSPAPASVSPHDLMCAVDAARNSAVASMRPDSFCPNRKPDGRLPPGTQVRADRHPPLWLLRYVTAEHIRRRPVARSPPWPVCLYLAAEGCRTAGSRTCSAVRTGCGKRCRCSNAGPREVETASRWDAFCVHTRSVIGGVIGSFGPFGGRWSGNAAHRRSPP